MDNISLLDDLIMLYANGNQAEFARKVAISESTIKAWRSRNSVPADKVVLLKLLMENIELKQFKDDFQTAEDLIKRLSISVNNH